MRKIKCKIFPLSDKYNVLKIKGQTGAQFGCSSFLILFLKLCVFFGISVDVNVPSVVSDIHLILLLLTEVTMY